MRAPIEAVLFDFNDVVASVRMALIGDDQGPSGPPEAGAGNWRPSGPPSP